MNDLGPFLQHLHGELSRRRVFRVAAAYAAAGFVVWQAADIAFPALGLPAWTMTFVVVLALLGFPFVLVMAWIFDVTPTGLRRTDPLAPGDATSARPASRRPATIIAIAGVVILTIAAAAFALRPDAAARPAPDAELSIVVLPFVNQSGDAGNEYFSDGVAEAILGRLNRIENLRVISRTSAMSYKGTTKQVRQIGAELGVAYVVEGSVSRSGSRVRIHVQLVESDTDRTVWSDSFNRELDDIFAVETEISERIAGALRVRLTATERGRLASSGTNSVVAYDLYMKAREHGRNRVVTDWSQGRSVFYSTVALYRQALDADPGYALAWADLAQLYLDHVDLPADVQRDSAEVMARRAIQLAPELPEGYVALGLLLRRRQQPGAERQFELALERDPAHVQALLALAHSARDSLRYVDAGRLSLKAHAHAPTDLEPVASLYDIFVAVGDYEEAERWAERGIALSADAPDWGLDFSRAYVAAVASDTAGAREHLRRGLASAPDMPFVWDYAAAVQHEIGDHAAALANRERYLASLDGGGAPPRDRAFAMSDLAWVLIDMGALERGEELLVQAERLIQRERESCPDTCLNTPIAMIRAHFGDVEGAVEYLSNSIRIGWIGRYPDPSVDRRFSRVSHDPRIRTLIDDLRASLDAQRETLQRELAQAAPGRPR